MVLGKKQVWPSKTTLNLVISEKPADYYKNITIAAVIAIALICVFGKFAVADRLAAADRAWEAADANFSRYEALMESNRDYNEVRGEYGKYFANNTARGDVTSCAEVMRIIDERLLGSAVVKSVSFSGNTLSVVLQGISLEGATRILTELYEREELVRSVELYTATNPDGQEASIAMTIGLNAEGGAADDAQP